MNPQLPAERHQRILNELHQTGRIIAQQLATSMGVSIDTVRRDLTELAAQGLLVKVHGGAVQKSEAYLPRAERVGLHHASKVAIGQTAVNLIRPGQTVLFDNSTTVLEIARHIPHDLAFTAITHSLHTALELASHPQVDVIMLGGKIDRKEMMCSDGETFERLSQFNADLCFLGICGLHPDIGVTTSHYEDMLIKQALVRQSQVVVAPVSQDKLNQVLPFRMCPIDALDYLLLETAPSAEDRQAFEQAGVTILLAEGNSP
ncbi:DeoR/GlpR family DNA-binding transcription regulator [Leeia oryzae]|uniref:DeoR/GlpR family DNA-binding transcription regulator n=1 Tax=Leeia oryzae TaxID=356662 RepID=UPI0003772AC7|nr:DeoR/GlpR family DNA-binding transcription regulator [Leeia oryzae]